MKLIHKLLTLILCMACFTSQMMAMDEDFTRYLFVYFPSNSNENVYYALSDNGFDYTPMNDGQMIISADTISLKKGVRDPHILRGEDGWFYMVLTDMRCAEGWNSNRGLVMMRSRDLVNWTHSTVHFPTKYKGTMFAKVTRVWAPETIWDPQEQKYMVYFSLLTSDSSIPYDKVFYCYANEDFTDLEGEPTFLFDRGDATIDMDIVYNDKDGLFHGFFKNENAGGICKVTAQTLTAAEGQPLGSQWSDPSDKLQQTNEAVEGAGVFKLINQDKWVLMYDCYMNGHYQFCESTDLTNFTFKQNTVTSGAFTPRHGTVIPVTDAEVEAINNYLLDQENQKKEEQLRQMKASLQQEVEHAKMMNVPTNDIASQLMQDELSQQDIQDIHQTLNVRVFEEGLKNYPEDKTPLLGRWNKSNEKDNQGQHWDGSATSTYFEQNNGWADNAWQMTMQQRITLPAGSYVLKASGRSASEAVVATMSVNDQSLTFPTKADNGYGITTDGRASFDPTDSYANNGKGRGWEWRYLPFTLTEPTQVTIRLQATVTNATHQWVSISNLTLLYSATNPTPITTPSTPAINNTPEAYTLSGQPASHHQTGIHIIRQPDGTSHKVLLR